MENERIAKNQRAQLLALDQPLDLPPDDADDEDWMYHGAQVAQANSSATAEEREAITEQIPERFKFTALLNEMNAEANNTNNSVAPLPKIAPQRAEQEAADIKTQLESFMNSMECGDEIGSADDTDDRLFDDISSVSTSTETEGNMKKNTMQSTNYSDTQAQSEDDGAPWVGGTSIEEADIPEPELDDEYVSEEAPEDQP